MKPNPIPLEERLRDAERAVKESGGKDEMAKWEVDWLRTRIQCRDTIDLFAEEDREDQ